MAIELTDMMGRRLFLNAPPTRIVSLVPSQTELLYELGAGEYVVGQTVFCIHPQDQFKSAVKVGGTKKIKHEVIASLQPDLIICNKEENTEAIVNRLSESWPVWVSDIKTIEDACRMITAIGTIVGRDPEAQSLAEKIRHNFSSGTVSKTRTCLYLIWKNPYMAAGADTFINQMLLQAGFENLLPEGSRYPEMGLEEMIRLQPEVLLLSSEPYPFTDKHIRELSHHLPDTRIMLVDGEFFSWYGSRLVNSQLYFNHLQEKLNS